MRVYLFSAYIYIYIFIYIAIIIITLFTLGVTLIGQSKLPQMGLKLPQVWSKLPQSYQMDPFGGVTLIGLWFRIEYFRKIDHHLKGS